LKFAYLFAAAPALVLACSALDFAGLESQRDGASQGDASQGDAGARCNPDGAFTKLVIGGPINTLNFNETSGRMTDNELTLYFARDNGVTFDLYVATRNSTSDDFGTPTAISELNTTDDEYDPFLLRDGVTMYFASTRDAGGRAHVFRAVRPSTTSAFGAATEVSALDVSESTASPWFLPDDATIFYDDDYDNLVYTAKASSGTFTPPTQLKELGVQVGAPVVTGDGLTMLYAKAGTSDDDIWIGKRTDTTQPFVTSVVPELTTPGRDIPTWISTDGCHAVVSSTGSKSMDLYFANRAP
jgi:hypothetical protein